jgi:hypothetical protein
VVHALASDKKSTTPNTINFIIPLNMSQSLVQDEKTSEGQKQNETKKKEQKRTKNATKTTKAVFNERIWRHSGLRSKRPKERSA